MKDYFTKLPKIGAVVTINGVEHLIQVIEGPFQDREVTVWDVYAESQKTGETHVICTSLSTGPIDKPALRKRIMERARDYSDIGLPLCIDDSDEEQLREIIARLNAVTAEILDEKNSIGSSPELMRKSVLVTRYIERLAKQLDNVPDQVVRKQLRQTLSSYIPRMLEVFDYEKRQT